MDPENEERLMELMELMAGGDVEGVAKILAKNPEFAKGEGGQMKTASMKPMIELLLDHGWDINRGQLLHDAQHGHGSRVRIWLAYGADPNARDEDGMTALHLLAARGVGRDAIRALVRAGADVSALNKNGKTALDLARLATRQTASEELVRLGARV